MKYSTREWLEAALIRTVRTMAETALSVIGTTAVIGGVDWKVVASSTALSGICTILLAIKGLPEVK